MSRADPLDDPLCVLAGEFDDVEARAAADQLALDDADDAFELEDEEFDPDAVRERAKKPAKRSASGGQSEAGLTRDVVKDVNRRPRYVCQKIIPTAAGGKGEPDLDIVGRTASGLGRSVKIELKVGDKRPTGVQTRRLLQWQEVGALVGWATSLDEVDQILAHLDDPAYQWTPDMGSGAPPVAA